MGHRPDVLPIDYGLNDRGLGLVRAEAAWRAMLERALTGGVKVVLLPPTCARCWTGRGAGPRRLCYVVPRV